MPVDAPHCPRCDYDLSGDVATWKTACPLEGVCPECGVDLRWRAVLQPDLAALPGFFEHRTGPASLMRTWLWTLLPWVFWKRVGLEGRVRPARAWLWLGLLVLALHAAASTLGMAAHFVAVEARVSHALMGVSHDLEGYVFWWMHPIMDLTRKDTGVAIFWEVLWTPDFVFALTAFFFAYPLMLLTLVRSLGAAKVRWAHVQRAVAYGAVWIALLALFRAGSNAVYLVECSLIWVGLRQTPDFEPLPAMLYEYATPVGAALFIWVGVWWLCCFTRGWRMRHGAAVWVLLTFAAALCAVMVNMREQVLALFG